MIGVPDRRVGRGGGAAASRSRRARRSTPRSCGRGARSRGCRRSRSRSGSTCSTRCPKNAVGKIAKRELRESVWRRRAQGVTARDPLAGVAIAGVGMTRAGAASSTRHRWRRSLEAAKAALADAGMTRARRRRHRRPLAGPGRDRLPARLGGLGGAAGHPRPLDRRHLPAGRARRSSTRRRRSRAGLCDTVLITGGQAGVMARGGGQGRLLHAPRQRVRRAVRVVHHRAVRARRAALPAPVPAHAREAMAEVAATIRNNGHAQPRRGHARPRALHGRRTCSPRRRSSSPFTLLELCLANEGAAAVVVTTLERARDCPKPPVRRPRRRRGVDAPAVRRPAALRGGVDDRRRRRAARVRDGRARRPTTSTSSQLYDVNSSEVLRQFEALGLLRRGGGRRLRARDRDRARTAGCRPAPTAG